MAESKEELKSLLMRLKEENERASLRINIIKAKIMASGPISAWQIEGENVEVVIPLKSLHMLIEAMKSEDDCLLAGNL